MFDDSDGDRSWNRILDGLDERVRNRILDGSDERVLIWSERTRRKVDVRIIFWQRQMDLSLMRRNVKDFCNCERLNYCHWIGFC